MAIQTFSDTDALKYGVREAIVLHAIKGVIMFDTFPIHYADDGNYARFTPSELTRLVPYYTESQVKRAIESLITNGAIEAANFNDHKFDRVRWFKIND